MESFCRKELGGWPDGEAPEYRIIQIIAAPFEQLNLEYQGWGGDLNHAFDDMLQNTQRFFPQRLAIQIPIARLEEQAQTMSPRGLWRREIPNNVFFPDSQSPDKLVTTYARGTALGSVVREIRQELTNHLLRLH
jgi:hypothetical protein